MICLDFSVVYNEYEVVKELFGLSVLHVYGKRKFCKFAQIVIVALPSIHSFSFFSFRVIGTRDENDVG